jgi:hypothetical protein
MADAMGSSKMGGAAWIGIPQERRAPRDHIAGADYRRRTAPNTPTTASSSPDAHTIAAPVGRSIR